jgi:hypothetical protein
MSDPGRSEAEPGHVAITVAAMTGPAPKMPVRLVPDAFDRDGQLLPRLADLGVPVAHVLQELGGEPARR